MSEVRSASDHVVVIYDGQTGAALAEAIVAALPAAQTLRRGGLTSIL